MKSVSLSTRVFLGTALAALGAVLVYGVLTNLTLRRELAGFAGQRDVQLARSVARVMEESLQRSAADGRLPDPGSALVLQRLRESIGRDREWLGAVGPARGVPMRRSQPVFDAPVLVASADGETVLDTRPGDRPAPDPDLVRSSGVAARLDGTVRAYVLAGSMIDPAIGPGRELQTRLLAWSLLAAATALLAAALVGLAIRGSISSGIRPLQDAAGELASGHFGARIGSPGFPDLEPLRGQFNRMAESLEQAESRRRGFLHDIAHEIRTPISLIAGRLEMMGEGVYPTDSGQLAALQADVARLSGLVQALETSAWDSADAEVAPVSLPEFLEELCRDFAPQADRARIRFLVDADASLPEARVPAGHLRQILSNLISNAVRYEPPGGTVELRAAEVKHGLLITVRDHGIGIPPQLGERVFERFVRGDESRSRDTGGSGLGLSIARELATAGNMPLRLADPQPRPGACFELLLPLG